MSSNTISGETPKENEKRKALVLIADGTEEMEFTIVYDTLVRAGVDVTSAAVRPYAGEGSKSSSSEVQSAKISELVTCSRGVKIVADTTFDSISAPSSLTYNLLVIPGGAKGAETLSTHPRVQELIKSFLGSGRWVGMICAGSLAALESKLDSGYELTSHPSVKDKLASEFNYKEESVVVSNRLVTSRGPGTTFPFALKLVQLLFGDDKMREVYEPMVFPSNGSQII